MPVLITVLGSIEAHNGESIPIGGSTQRRLLALLAHDAGEVVSLDRLVDLSWTEGEAPARAERNVRTYVHRLRSAFGPELAERIETVEPGYRLRLGRGELDAERFDELASSAARLAAGGDATGALDVIAQAEGLWQGRPYGEFADESWALSEVKRLDEVRIGLRELRSELLISAARHAEAVAHLEQLIVEVPLRERPRRLLMQALYLAGRQVEALRAFQDFRDLLIEEVGVEPSTDLIELDRAMTTGDTDKLIPESARRTVGAYEIHEEIGTGAFAIVYRGVQKGLERPVAIKAIRAELANRPEFIRRFEAEAHMVARLEHPHIVPLYDYWREPDRAYLVMRWLPGGTLEQSLAAGPWTLDRTIRMVEQVGSALAVAHRSGVVHRDVRSANIVLDDVDNAFLADFGIALATEERRHPEAAPPQGWQPHASPEQSRKEPPGPSADIHGLALAAYEALTAELPFGDHADPTSALRRQWEEPIPLIRERRPDLPAAVEDVLQRAATTNPAERYQDVREFVEAFTSASSTKGPGPIGRAQPLTVIAAETDNPYKGLRAFEESDSDDFFGRERLVDELIGRMSDGASGPRLLAVVGPSGSGKSSVVRAGLLPALRRGRVAGADEWFVTTMNPGAHPFEQLETALLRVAVNPPASLLDQLSAGPRGILRGVQRALPDDRTTLLVVIDQFEELFTLCGDDGIRAQFLAGLVTAATEPDSPIRVVLTLRADFFDRPLRHPEFATLIKQNSITVTPLAGDELERAIVDPADRVGVEFEPGLVAEIVAEVAGQPGALPLMQYALTELFETNASGLLLLERYRELGGLSGALAQRADDVYEASTPEEQSAIRALFGRLITLGEGSEDTRRRVRRSEAIIDESTDRVIDRYGSARLLTFDHDPNTREPTVEVAHEALIREWPRLRSWLDDDRQGLRIHRHLTNSAASWVERDHDDEELYRGVRLDAATTWVDAAGPVLNPIEVDFLAASTARHEAEERAERNRIRRLRRLVLTIGLIALIALVTGAIAVREQRRADDQAALAAENESKALANAQVADERADEAETARAQADVERVRALAQATAPENPDLAALLAVEAHTLDPSIESLDVLHRVLTAVPGFRGRIVGGQYLDAELLDDGVTLAVVGLEVLDVWDLRTRERIHSLPHANDADTSAFDVVPDGRLAVARAGTSSTVFYDLQAGEMIGEVVHEVAVNDVSLNAGGTRMAAARVDGGVEIWDTATLELEQVLGTGTEGVAFARWNPDRDEIAAVTDASAVQLWELAADQPRWSVAAPEAQGVNFLRPFATTFTPDGTRLVVLTGSLDSQLRVFDVATGSEPFAPTPVGHRTNLGFPLDGLRWIDAEHLVISVPSGEGSQTYDLTTGEPLGTELSELSVEDIVYSDPLDRFVTVSRGGIGLWSDDGSGPLERVVPLTPDQQEALAVNGGSIHTSLAADGSQLLVSALAFPAANPPTMAWDLDADPFRGEIFDASGPVTIGWGEYTLVGSFAGVEMLDAAGEPLGPRAPLPFDFNEVAASPDGRFFAVGRDGGLLDLHTSDGELVATLAMGPPEEFAKVLTGPSFTSDGRLVAANTTDGRYAIWSTDTLQRVDITVDGIIGALEGPWIFLLDPADGSVRRVDPWTSEVVGDPLVKTPFGGYSRVDTANMRLAGVGTNEVRVIDLETGKQLGRELPYRSMRIEWTADGSVLSVPGEDRVTLWNFDTDTWADIACEMAGRNLTAGEWNQFGPGTVERRATCSQYPLP